MKRLYQLIAFVFLGGLLFSCDKSEPIGPKGKNSPQTERQNFEMQSLFASPKVELLGSNTDDVSAEDLRATLYFNGLNKPATTTLKAKDFGSGRRQARWGVVYDGGKYYAENCDDAVSVEPNNPVNNTVYFKETTKNHTIQGSGIRMFCRTSKTLHNISKGFMVLEGEGGTGGNLTKQYFKGATDPNHRLEPLFTNDYQDGRHIPIMTPVEDFADITRPLGSTKVKFSPRGSLIGLSIKNRVDKDIIITHILVEKSGALDYSGYFDWEHLVGNRASFHPEYATGAKNLEFPVYAYTGAVNIGYTLKQNNVEMPCFYIWGFQNPNKLGKDFQIKIRYKIKSMGVTLLTRPFNIFAPKSKLVPGTKQFDDGYSYKAMITVDLNNWIDGGFVDDWGDGVALINDSAPLSVSQGFTTPLDFVAEAPAINKAGTKFVKNHKLPHTNVIGDMDDEEVGYYTYYEAKDLFTEKAWLKNSKYYLPSKEQWRSIVPEVKVINFYYGFNKRSITERSVQIGEMPVQDYTSDFIAVQEGDSFATYAVRFKGTDWVSAWRYARRRDDGNNRLIVKCFSLKGKPSTLLNVENVAKEELFTPTNCSIRTFPAYGDGVSGSSSIGLIGGHGYYSSATSYYGNSNSCAVLRFTGSDSFVYWGYNKVTLFPVRPFVRP